MEEQLNRNFIGRETATKLAVTANHLIYWEKQGKLKPSKVTVGNRTLVVYTPALMERAREILNRNIGKNGSL